jgi:hypothetical protein
LRAGQSFGRRRTPNTAIEVDRSRLDHLAVIYSETPTLALHVLQGGEDDDDGVPPEIYDELSQLRGLDSAYDVTSMAPPSPKMNVAASEFVPGRGFVPVQEVRYKGGLDPRATRARTVCLLVTAGKKCAL